MNSSGTVQNTNIRSGQPQPKSLALLGKIQRRFVWLSYCFAKRLQLAVWDLLSLQRAGQIVERSALYRHEMPPVLDDTMFPCEGFTKPCEEAIYSVQGNAILEPEFGYVIVRPFAVIEPSLRGAEFVRGKNEDLAAFTGYPSLIAYLLYKLGRKPVQREEKVISFCHAWGSNYYHFLHDNLGRLRLIDGYLGDSSIPLVVDKATAKLPAFQELSQRGDLKNRRWIILDKSYIEAKEIIFARSCPNVNEDLDYLLKMIEAPEPDQLAKRRLYVDRPSSDTTIKTGRYVRNMEALYPILNEYGFEIINPGTLTAELQMQTFSEARVVIGIHGAALTNIIFRQGRRMELLEIFGPNDAPAHFYQLSRQLGYNYRCMRGSNPDNKSRTASFEVDAEAFRGHIEAIIKATAA